MFALLSDVADLSPLHMKASPRHDRVVLRHIMDSPGWVSSEEIEDAVWGADPDGGPLCSRSSIPVIIRHIRNGLRPGFEIESQMGRGSRGYRLVVREEVILEQVAKALGA